MRSFRDLFHKPKTEDQIFDRNLELVCKLLEKRRDIMLKAAAKAGSSVLAPAKGRFCEVKYDWSIIDTKTYAEVMLAIKTLNTIMSTHGNGAVTAHGMRAALHQMKILSTTAIRSDVEQEHYNSAVSYLRNYPHVSGRTVGNEEDNTDKTSLRKTYK